MQTDLHNDMRHIIDTSLVGETSPAEQQKLRKHLLTCAACQKYASDSRRAIVGLNGFSFAVQPGLTEKIHAALDQRAQQMQTAQPGRRSIVQVSLAALLLTVVGSFAAVRLGNPLAALLHLPLAQAQAGLFTLWIVPSWCFALVLPLLLLFSARSAERKGHLL